MSRCQPGRWPTCANVLGRVFYYGAPPLRNAGGGSVDAEAFMAAGTDAGWWRLHELSRCPEPVSVVASPRAQPQGAAVLAAASACEPRSQSGWLRSRPG